MSYNKLGDRVGVSGGLKNVKRGDGRNQDNQYATDEDMVDSDDRVIATKDLTNGVLIDI